VSHKTNRGRKGAATGRKKRASDGKGTLQKSFLWSGETKTRRGARKQGKVRRGRDEDKSRGVSGIGCAVGVGHNTVWQQPTQKSKQKKNDK